MQRFGRVLRLRKSAEAEYDKYHANIWPEVLETIKKSGFKNYTIFRYGRWLFSYFELPEGLSLDKAGDKIAQNEACRRWEELMHKFQEPLPESGKTFWWVPMKEIWHGKD